MRLLILPLLILSGCTTVADLRESPPFIQVVSQRSVASIQQCISKQWESRSGTTSYSPREVGFSMSLNYKVYSNQVTAAVVDVVDSNGQRTITVHAKGEGSKLRNEIAACT